MTVLGDVRALLGGARRGAEGGDAIAMIALPIGARAFGAHFGDVLWAPARGVAIAGSGVAAMIRAEGEARFAEVRVRARSVFERMRVVALGDGPPRPRLIGGFSFHPRPPGEPWTAFGSASFVLPRLAHVVEGGQHWMCLALGEHELGDPRLTERALDELSRALDPETFRERRPAIAARPEPPRDDGFIELVRSICREIEGGALDKVVAARTASLELAIDPALVLRRLEEHARGCTRFAFARGEAVFLGATPERLVDKRGRRVWTEALAGSATSPALLATDKQHNEHAIVRDDIVRRLSELGAVDFSREPEVRALRHLMHLCTPISARLDRDCHVLELVERLHPTPAVGGHPRARALEFLARHEHFERGWYASPIGWFDAAGDGDFAVALRTGLFEPRRAHLFAGAGIVKGSVPELELCETELKLAALREVVEAN